MLKIVPWYICSIVSRLMNLLWKSGMTNYSRIIISWKAAKFFRLGVCWEALTTCAFCELIWVKPVVLAVDRFILIGKF